MSEWQCRTVGDLFDVELGKMLSPRSAAGRQWPYLANRNVQWGRLALDDLGSMHFSAAERQRYALRSGDVLVCEGGEIGRTAIWKGEIKDCYFQNALHRLRPKAGADSRFMRHFMEQAAVAGRLRPLAGQTSIAHLPKERLIAWRVQFPPIEEQRRIAEILDTLDDAIVATQRLIVKQTQLVTAVETDIFANTLRAGVMRAVEAAREITVGVVSSATHAYTDDGVPFVRSQNIRPNRIDLTDLLRVRRNFVESVPKTRLMEGDVLVVRTGYPGTAGVVDSSLAGGSSFSLLVVRFDVRRYLPEYFARYLNSTAGKASIRSAQFGSAQHNLNVAELRRIEVPRVTVEAQARAVNDIRIVERPVECARAELAKLRALRAGLADDLLTGRVQTVPV